MPKDSELLTTTRAAERLGVSRSRVQQLVRSGRLPAIRAGRDYLIAPSDLHLVQDRTPGRPLKPAKTP